jgi:hypothetical protein
MAVTVPFMTKTRKISFQVKGFYDDRGERGDVL